MATALGGQVRELAAEPFSAPGPGVTRYPFTPAYERTIARVAELMRDARLEPSRDVVGNLIGRPPIPGRGAAFGSHLDSVRGGGAWDGTLGVVAGIEAARLASELGLTALPRVVSWVEEEGAGYGEALLGSRVAVGDVDLTELDGRVRSLDDGRPFSEHRAEATLEIDRPQPPSAIADELDAWVELHIEQGTVLEKAGAEIGVVTAIAGYLHADIVLGGRADHAGAAAMDLRSDTMPVAAEVILGAEQAARAAGHGTVATVGAIEATPGQINVVPQTVRLTLDIRSTVDDAVSAAFEQVVHIAQAAARARGVSVKSTVRQRRLATTLDERTVRELTEAGHALGVEPVPIVSRAAHDTMCLAKRMRAAMLFIPCRGGISYTPDEDADPHHAATAVQILVRWLAMQQNASPVSLPPRQPPRRA